MNISEGGLGKHGKSLFLLVAGILIIGPASCETEMIGPGEVVGGILVALSGADGFIGMIERKSRRVIRVPDGPRYIDAAVVANEGTRVLAVGFGTVSSERELFEIDVTKMKVVRREELEVVEAGERITEADDVVIRSDRGVSLSPDGDYLLFGGSWNVNGDRIDGIIVVNRDTWRPEKVLATINTAPLGLTTFGPTEGYPNGAVVAGGAHSVTEEREARLTIFRWPSLNLEDSVVIGEPANDEWGGLRQVLATDDGESIFGLTRDKIYEYSLGVQEVVSVAARPHEWSNATLALAEDGSNLFLTDPGDGRNSPGSGLIHVFDSSLRRLEPFDLRGVFDELPVARRIRIRGDTIFVITGTAERGPLYPVQEAKVIVGDSQTGTIDEIYDLNAFGIGQLLYVIERME